MHWDMGNEVCQAIKDGDHQGLEKLAKDGADLSVVFNKELYRPAHFAACWSQYECLKVLLKHKANISSATRSGYTPACLADRFCNDDVRDKCVKILNAANRKAKMLSFLNRTFKFLTKHKEQQNA